MLHGATRCRQEQLSSTCPVERDGRARRPSPVIAARFRAQNPSLAVGSSVFTLIVAVAPTVAAGTTLTNTATATSSTPDGNPGNESGTATTTVRSPANVTGNKSRSGGSTPGSTLSYLIILSNSSASDQQDNPGNEFTDVLSSYLTLVAASASSGTATANTGTNTVTWNGVVPAGDTITITIDAIIKSGTEDQTMTNQGTISYDADGNGTNEASASTNTDSFSVGGSTGNADVGVTKLASAEEVLANTDVTYTITVTNGGPDPAVNATLNDPLPGNMTFVSLSAPADWSCTTPSVGSTGTVSCTNSSLPLTNSQTFTLVGHVPTGTAAGTTYINKATVSTTSSDENSENDESNASTVVATCLASVAVTTNADSGPGSLRQAVVDVCPGGTIGFDMNQVVSPISLSGGQITIGKNLTIEGQGADLLTVRNTAAASSTSRVFNLNSGVNATISGLTISGGNVSSGFGGGILYGTNSTVTVTNSTISGNSASGGAGISNSSGGTLTVTNSTISGNSAGNLGGGGIFSGSGVLNVTNSTISGNMSTDSGGGGIINGGTGTVTNSTISNNSTSGGADGGGIRNAGTVNSRNSIIAGNTASSGAPDFFGTLTSQGHNLIGNTSGMSGTVATDITNVNPLLGPLANNGGPTQTMALLPGSPAINAGDNCVLDDTCTPALGFSLTTDQRDAGFSRIVGTNVDIGAFESRGFTITATSGTPQSATIMTPFSAPLVATVSSSFGEPVAGGVVTFTAPGSGASGTFPGAATTAIANTNSSGVATAPTFTANGTAGSYNVVASIGTGLPTAIFALTNNKLDQTITFGALAPQTFGDADFSVSATATSGLAVSLSANGNCTVTSPSPGTVHLTGAGSCTITASQSGNATYNAASDVQQSFTIAKAASATAVSSSINPSSPGQNVTFTATVISTAGTPTGTVQFKDGGTNLGSPQTLNGSGVATFSTSSLVVGLHTITADYSGDGNFLASTGTLSGGQQVGSIITFSSSNYDTTEGSGFTTITVQRIGDLSQEVSVDYSTPDDSSAMTVLPCSTANGVAFPRCDFETALGTLRFAAGDGAAKTFTVLINQDSFVEGPETLTLTLSNLTGGAGFATPGATTLTATLTIADDVTEPATNPIDDTETFVRQHYRDFLNREPDASGLAFWKDNIDKCNDPARRPPGSTVAQCIEIFRINTSAAFFLSIEFQSTGYLVERLYKASYADATGTSLTGGAHQITVPIVKFSEFLQDTQTIRQGVIVGQTDWETVLENNKQAFTAEFVTRSRFTTAYPNTLTPAQFVDMLFANAGVVPTATERQAAIDEFGGAGTSANAAARGRALRRVAENGTLFQQEFNRAFVLMEYFGYLRRNPNAAPDSDFSGYDFWLTKLNNFTQPGDDVLVRIQKTEMVKAFISSGEYRQRFGP